MAKPSGVSYKTPFCHRYPRRCWVAPIPPKYMKICQTCGTHNWVPETSCSHCAEPFYDVEVAWTYVGDLGNGNYFTPPDFTVTNEDTFYYDIEF